MTKLCHNPRSRLNYLAEIVNSNNPEALISFASEIRSPRQREIDLNGLSNSLIKQVNLVFR